MHFLIWFVVLAALVKFTQGKTRTFLVVLYLVGSVFAFA